MKILENGTEQAFPYERYLALKNKVKRNRHSLFFEGDGIIAARCDSRKLRDPALMINTYSTKLFPPYERVLKDIEDAAEEFERQIKQG